jgi:5-methylcytosine-specific restriction endonuclease McrA
MGRLSGLKPTIGRLAPRVGYTEGDAKGFDKQRRQTVPWRAWYNLARWKDLRLSILERDMFTCRMCGRTEGDTSKLVCDHRIPHKGNASLFWDASNLQTLCKSPCHDQHKQAQEKNGSLGSSRWL